MTAVRANCGVCGATDAVVRDCELPDAAVTGRAHVDHGGHSQYRHLSNGEWSAVREAVAKRRSG